MKDMELRFDLVSFLQARAPREFSTREIARRTNKNPDSVSSCLSETIKECPSIGVVRVRRGIYKSIVDVNGVCVAPEQATTVRVPLLTNDDLLAGLLTVHPGDIFYVSDKTYADFPMLCDDDGENGRVIVDERVIDELITLRRDRKELERLRELESTVEKLLKHFHR